MLWDSQLYHDRLGPQDTVSILKLRDIFVAMEIDSRSSSMLFSNMVALLICQWYVLISTDLDDFIHECSVKKQKY